MKTVNWLSKIAILVSVCVLLGQTPATHGALSYHVRDLGSLGGDFSVGLDVNNNGQVTGYSQPLSGGTHAFLYSGGVMTDLGTLGGTTSFGRSINDSGQVAGDSLLSGGSITPTDFSHAFLYSGGAMTDLGTLGGNRSAGYGINASGQITGWSSVTGDVFPNYTTRTFLYSGSGMSNLGSGNGVAGHSINAGGQVAGGGFVWTPNTPNSTTGSWADLGSLGGGGTRAFGINDGGQVAGYSRTLTGAEHVFVSYSGGPMIDLGAGRGAAINASGQVVGEDDNFAFLYSDGLRTNLNTLIDPASGWVLESANGINDSSWITGKGTIGGVTHAFLLTPVPEPSALVLAVLGLLIMGMQGVRQRNCGGSLRYCWHFRN